MKISTLRLPILLLAAFSLASAASVTVNCVSDELIIIDRNLTSPNPSFYSCPSFNAGAGVTIQTVSLIATYQVVDDATTEIRAFSVEVLNSTLLGFTSLVTNEENGVFDPVYGPIIGAASNVNSQFFGSTLISLRGLTERNLPLPESVSVSVGLLFTTDAPDPGNAIPEPSTFALFAGALGGLALWRRR